MAREEPIPAFGNFILGETTSAGPRWKKYVERFEMMIEAYKVEDDQRKKALLLHNAGEDIFSIYSTFTNKKALKYDEVVKQINEYFIPKKSIEFEVYKFRSCRQKETESIDEYYARLRTLSENCEFHDVDLEIRMQIIQKCFSDRLRKKALQQSMTLQELLSFARSIEISEAQAKEMSNRNEEVFKVTKNRNSSNRSNESSKKCFRCGQDWPHQDKCPAMGKKCNICSKFNHFSAVCRRKTIASLKEEKESESDEIDEELI